MLRPRPGGRAARGRVAAVAAVALERSERLYWLTGEHKHVRVRRTGGGEAAGHGRGREGGKGVGEGGRGRVLDPWVGRNEEVEVVADGASG